MAQNSMQTLHDCLVAKTCANTGKYRFRKW